ncbi:DNA helicase MCM9-like isoform X2 [Malaya genurostris]|uniref:DNA helicase MCM9-like isoform X2 n=1 Tax=Malaya genurostris TaxID=325434 RepID=UPI0026F380B7|nr:DNA helicase MCM9-like isoform X2 [Malaya genurostris]
MLFDSIAKHITSKEKTHQSLARLQRKQLALYDALLRDSRQELPKWNASLIEAQKYLVEGNKFLEAGFQIKQNCYVRFVNMPPTSVQVVHNVAFPNNDHVGHFLQVKGRVFRMSQANFLEFKREYVCNRCRHEFTIEAQYEQSYVFDVPRSCPMALETGCKGFPEQKSAQPHTDYCRHSQEVRIQEIQSDKNIPTMLVITLENDLVDSCQPGDCVTIVGTVERRWRPLVAGRKTVATVSMLANSVCKDDTKMASGKELPEHLVLTKADWQNTVKDIGESAARDLLVQSICPEIYGMYPVKLALALSLASCTDRYIGCETAVRGHSHLLLIGDPGMAKSRLLKRVSEIAVRSIFTTGVGCSTAGLTAAAVKENGEWQLEAGALVLADGGVCCIDEFNLMREIDKGSLHEAMEQQRISMAKAGLVCKLSSRCVVLAATNPKHLYSMIEIGQTSNLGVGGPLLSRFDVVLSLSASDDVNWHSPMSNHVLSLAVVEESRERYAQTPSGGHWELERLQTHFQAIRDIHPKISNDANTILSAYYKRCRLNSDGTLARTTVRLLDSLVRISQAHTRLMFREEVTALDALVAVRLMDSSWGFGKIFRPIDLLRAPLPLGPDSAEIAEMLQILQLSKLVQEIRVEQVDRSKLNQYQQKLAATAKKKDATPVNKWDTVSVSPMSKFAELVLRDLDNNNKSDNKPAATDIDPNRFQSQKRSTSDVGDLYSKYSFTQNRKNATKKIKVSEPTRLHSSKKVASKNTMPLDASLKENLGNGELDCILSSLRQNFMKELSKATQPNIEEIIPQSSQVTSSGRSQTLREESFNAMLDVSNLLDDDELATNDSQQKNIQTAISLASTETGLSVFNDCTLVRTNSVETFPSIQLNRDHTPLVNPIAEKATISYNSMNKFQFKRPQKDQLRVSQMLTPSASAKFPANASAPFLNIKSLRDESDRRFTCENQNNATDSLCSTYSNTVMASEAKESVSRYQFKHQSQKNRTNPVEMSPMLLQSKNDVGVNRETTGKRKLSDQTLSKLRGFEFIRQDQNKPNNESKDNSSQASHTAKAAKITETSVFVTLGEQRDPDEDLAFLDAIDF